MLRIGTFFTAHRISLLGLLSPILSTLPAIALPLIFIPVVFASFYANACDVFDHIGPDDAA